MKCLILFIFLIIFFKTTFSQYNPGKDSLFIYNIYKDEIQLIKNDSTWSHIHCKIIENYADSITERAKIRLERYNHHIYLPVKKYIVEGSYNEAYLFPEPSFIYNHDSITTSLEYNSEDNSFYFSIIYPQTRFICKKDGKTLIPYVEQIFYNDKLKPILRKKLRPDNLKEIEFE